MAMIVFGLYLHEKADAPYFVERGSQFWYLHRHWRMFKKTGTHFNENVQKVFELTQRPPHIRYFGVYQNKDVARRAEQMVIKHFGRLNNGTGCLFNETDGGRKKNHEGALKNCSQAWTRLSPEAYEARCSKMRGAKRRKALGKLLSCFIQIKDKGK